MPDFERRMVVWLEGSTLDEVRAMELARAGVDEVVIRRGTVRFGGGTPVLRLGRPPEIAAGPLPVGIALLVEELAPTMDGDLARATWQALRSDLAGLELAELILDLPRLQPGLDAFIAELAAAAGRPVVPILTAGQLRTEEGLAVASAARTCIVPLFGTDGAVLRGVGELATESVMERLAPLASAGVLVRPAVVLKPRTEPPLEGWGENLDLLCENELTSVSTSSDLDRSFVFNRATRWSGRDWAEGESVAVRWVDAARLDGYLRESERLILPQVAGWDLVPVIDAAAPLSIGMDGVIKYLGGRGPAPEMKIQTRRLGGNRIEVALLNSSPFTSAVSAYGNWLEVTVTSGNLVAQDRGDFDHIILGTRRHGDWQSLNANVVDSVRFHETYVGAHEVMRTGAVRMPSQRSEVLVRWQVTLTSGAEVSGVEQVR